MSKDSGGLHAGTSPREDGSAIVCLDGKNRIVSFDRGAERLFGARSGEVLGQPIQSLLIGFREKKARSAESGVFALAVANPLPHTVTVEVRASIFRVRRALFRVLVISPRRDRHTSRACERLSAIVAHDLRASVGGLLMAMEVLRTMRAQTASSAALFEQTVQGAAGALRHMDRLIQDLSDAHSLNAGTFPLTEVRIKPARLLQLSLASVRPLVTHNALRVRCAPQLPDVSADPHRVTQVLSNLLHNAKKAAPPRSPITVSVGRDGGFVRFSVMDRGAGLPADCAARLTRPVDAPRGTRGLGLMIARNIVEAHGGRIWAENGDEGCTVSFTIPISPQEARRR